MFGKDFVLGVGDIGYPNGRYGGIKKDKKENSNIDTAIWHLFFSTPTSSLSILIPIPIPMEICTQTRPAVFLTQNESTTTEGSDSAVEKNLLNSKWNMYFHLPVDKDNRWTLDSYKEILFQMSFAEEVIGVVRGLKENVVKYGLLFLMRTPISPIWEDPRNRGMGAFSYKVSNRSVCEVWKNLCYAVCGESLCVIASDSRHVNGISISPKKGFCCIKIWMDTLELQDPSIFVEIPGLIRAGCLFRKHDS